jgi:hypothetical protein
VPVEVWVEFDRNDLTKSLFPENKPPKDVAIIDLGKVDEVETPQVRGKVRIKLRTRAENLVAFINGGEGGRDEGEDKYFVASGVPG